MKGDRLPVSYAAASLYGLGIERDLHDVMEQYEREEDAQREREEAEGELSGPTATAIACDGFEDGDFTHPCPLRDMLE